MNWKKSITGSIVVWLVFTGLVLHWNNTIPNELESSSILAASTIEAKSKKNPELKEIIAEVQELVVMIETETGTGSGFLYNDKGDIVTNAHVVEGSNVVTVNMVNGDKWKGTVIGIGKETDIALVRVPDLVGKQPLKLADYKAEIGDEVLAFGSPLGLQNTTTDGIISGLNRYFELGPFIYEDSYQTTAPIAPGNSGGPLINMNTGEVLGINSAGIDQGNIGFSIPIINVLDTLESWSESPQLINTVDINTEIAEEDVHGLIYKFYDYINERDYVSAYELLGSNWQRNTDFAAFIEGYKNTEQVEIDSLQATEEEDTYAVSIEITAEEKKEESNVQSEYLLNYVVGYEDNQLVIISGEGKKVK